MMKWRLLTAAAMMVVGVLLAATAVAQVGANGPEVEVSDIRMSPDPAASFAAPTPDPLSERS